MMKVLIAGKFIRGIILPALIFCVALATVNSCQQALKQEEMNVLFIAFDDLKPLAGCYGNDMIRTPGIDRLAADGTVFLNNHCQQAVCGPSRASLMTGLLPDKTKIWDMGHYKMRDVHPDILTIPQYFKQHGYYATGVGKIFDGRCVDSWGEQDAGSWSEPYLKTPGRYFADTTYSLKKVPPELESVMVRPSIECSDVPDTVYNDGMIRQTAIRTLRRLSEKDEPFFLAVGFLKPHLSFTAPRKYWDLYERGEFNLPEHGRGADHAPGFALHNSEELRIGWTDIPLEGEIPPEKKIELLHGYYAVTSFVDAQLNMLLDELYRLGLDKNTIVVLWGDHGYHLWDHGIFCKHTNYEQATRSPLIISAPDMKRGHYCSSPTEFLDIFPTLCDLAGLPIPDHLDGQSLKPVLTGSADKVKAMARSQYPRTVEGNSVMGYTYRSDRYRYVEWIEKDYYGGETEGKLIARELYDYQVDPGESVNHIDNKEYQEALKWFENRISH